MKIWTVAEYLASACDALARCKKDPERYSDAIGRHRDGIAAVCEACLPSGSGFDQGSRFDAERSDLAKLVFYTAFHHMDENGTYAGWTEHTVTARPTFIGTDVRVSGPNRNDIKDYIADVFREALRRKIQIPYSDATGHGVTFVGEDSAHA